MKFATCFILNSLSISNNWPNFHEAIDIKASYARIPMQLVYIYIYILYCLLRNTFFYHSLIHCFTLVTIQVQISLKKRGGGSPTFAGSCVFIPSSFFTIYDSDSRDDSFLHCTVPELLGHPSS